MAFTLRSTAKALIPGLDFVSIFVVELKSFYSVLYSLQIIGIWIISLCSYRVDYNERGFAALKKKHASRLTWLLVF